jgi:hypothetical protein
LRLLVDNEDWSKLPSDATFSEPPELNQKSSHVYEEDATIVRKFLVGDSESNPFRAAEKNGKWLRRETDKRDSVCFILLYTHHHHRKRKIVMKKMNQVQMKTMTTRNQMKNQTKMSTKIMTK